MTDTIEVAGAPALSEAETKYFETGGESELPAELETGDAVDVADGTGGDAADGSERGDKKPDDDGTKTNLVPHQALHEQRERRKAAEKRSRELEIENAKYRERFSIIDKLYGKDTATADAAPPKPEEDIFGAFDHLAKQVEGLTKSNTETQQAARHTAQVQEFIGHYRNDAAKFEKTTPDFKDAYNFLLQSRATELMALGYDTPAELQQALQSDEMSIAQMAFQKDKSPAEVIYNLAKGRGYKKADPKADAEAKLDAIERGSSLNKSLSSAAGGAGDGEMTAEQLLSMPNDEFEAWCNKNPQKARRLMGA